MFFVFKLKKRPRQLRNVVNHLFNVFDSFKEEERRRETKFEMFGDSVVVVVSQLNAFDIILGR